MEDNKKNFLSIFNGCILSALPNQRSRYIAAHFADEFCRQYEIKVDYTTRCTFNVIVNNCY